MFARFLDGIFALIRITASLPPPNILLVERMLSIDRNGTPAFQKAIRQSRLALLLHAGILLLNGVADFSFLGRRSILRHARQRIPGVGTVFNGVFALGRNSEVTGRKMPAACGG
jgi:hypothetical protein